MTNIIHLQSILFCATLTDRDHIHKHTAPRLLVQLQTWSQLDSSQSNVKMLNGVEQKSAETSLRQVKRAVVAGAGILAVVFAVCKYFVVASEA